MIVTAIQQPRMHGNMFTIRTSDWHKSLKTALFRKARGQPRTWDRFDQNGLMIAESTSSGTITSEYAYLNGQPLAKIEGNNVFYFHADHIGTPMLMTDSSDATVWQGEYLPFGERYSITGSITNNVVFPGQYYDSETELSYNWFRYYDSKLGRYTSFDPILNPANGHLNELSCTGSSSDSSFFNTLLITPYKMNPYAYSDGNPINNIDPLGLSTCKRDCSDFLKRCYLLAGIGGVTTGIVCNTICIAITKYPVFCRVVCSGTGASVAGTLQLYCYKTYNKCMDKCKDCK